MHFNAKDYQSKVWKPIAKKYKQKKQHTRISIELNIEKTYCPQKRSNFWQFLQTLVHTGETLTKKAIFRQKKQKSIQFWLNQFSNPFANVPQNINTRKLRSKTWSTDDKSYFQLPTQLYPSVQWCKTEALTNLLH